MQLLDFMWAELEKIGRSEKTDAAVFRALKKHEQKKRRGAKSPHPGIHENAPLPRRTGEEETGGEAALMQSTQHDNVVEQTKEGKLKGTAKLKQVGELLTGLLAIGGGGYVGMKGLKAAPPGKNINVVKDPMGSAAQYSGFNEKRSARRGVSPIIRIRRGKRTKGIRKSLGLA